MAVWSLESLQHFHKWQFLPIPDFSAITKYLRILNMYFAFQAFVEFGIEPLDLLGDDEAKDDDIDEENELIGIDLESALENGEIEDQEYELPKQIKCGSHKLHNVAKHGTQKAMKDNLFGKIAKTCFGKIRAIWNHQSRSTNKADIIRDHCGGLFVDQGATRWNSFYHGLVDFDKKLSESDDGLASIAKELKFRPFTENEIKLVKEYIVVLEPVALALDKLQGDVGLGYVLPIVTNVYNCFDEMEELSFCEPLKLCLKREIKSRFDHLFQCKIHVLAALSDPQFKNYWISDSEYGKFAIDVFTEAVNKLKPKESYEPKAKVPKTTKSFGCFKPKSGSDDNILELYLSNTSQEVMMLKFFPLVEQIYRKTNTIFASSASVERVFSRGKLVFGFNRYNLKDESFEKQLMIESNQSFISMQ